MTKRVAGKSLAAGIFRDGAADHAESFLPARLSSPKEVTVLMSRVT